MRWLRRIGLSLVLVLFGYLAAGTLGGLIPGRVAALPQGEDQRILLVPGPIHTDILLPLTPELRTRFGFARGAGVPLDHPMAEWLAVGWGAHDFYTTVGGYSDVSGRAIWRAVSGDASVIRLEAWGRIPDNHGLTEIALSDDQFAALLEAIATSFAGDGPPTRINHPGFSEADAFFEARGRFSPLHTCNVWVGEMLRKAGLPVGAWTPFTWSLP